MKQAGKLFISLVLLQGAAYAQAPQPEIQVVEGKVSMAVQSMPLGRVISLLDRAMGFTSTVKPELANRNISVRFTNLAVKDAVHKIFEGQPINYMFVEGKGIRVTDLALGGPTTSSASSSSSFQDSAPISQPLSQPLPGISPVQQVQPANVPINTGQPAQQATTPFGNPTNAPAAAPATNTGAAPGQLPPPIGGANPLVNPAGAQPPVAPAGGFPVTPPPPPPPSGPGTLGGAAPGTIVR